MPYETNKIGVKRMNFRYQGLHIHYEIWGEESDQRPLLLLHGWGARIEAMAPIYQFFQKTRKVIVLDFPGQGGTSDTLPVAWGVPEYATMVKAMMQELQICGCDVIGHSFGGRIILWLASQDKTLFHKIVLTDAAGIKPKTNWKKQFRIYRYKVEKWLAKRILSPEEYEKKVEAMRKQRGSSDYAALSTDAMRETFQKVIHLDLSDTLPNIQNPTLLLWGENDTDTPMFMAKKMEQTIPDCGLVVLENAGHFSYLDQPQKYLVVVNQFLTERRA